MLNPTLYAALRNVYGSVLIDNENEPATIERIYGGARDWRMSDGASHGEQYRINCPFCQDRKHHLYISYLSFSRPEDGGERLSRCPLVAHCFKCNGTAEAGNIAQLVQTIEFGLADLPETGVPVNSIQSPVSSSSASLLQEDLDRRDSLLDKLRVLVPDFHFCKDGMMGSVRDYLATRQVTDDDIELFQLGWASINARSGKPINSGRPFVVIPVFMNGRLRGVQARAAQSPVAEGDLRYWTHPGMRKGRVVFNLDNARLLGTGVVTEGPFDAISVGRPGVCLFGHCPSETQMALLQTIGDCLIWLPDTDVSEKLNAVGEAQSLVDQLNAAGVYRLGAHLVRLPRKDAGEMPRQEIWEAIVAQVPETVQAHIIERILPEV